MPGVESPNITRTEYDLVESSGLEAARPDTNTNANSVTLASHNLEHSFDIDLWVATKILTVT